MYIKSKTNISHIVMVSLYDATFKIFSLQIEAIVKSSFKSKSNATHENEFWHVHHIDNHFFVNELNHKPY